MRTEPLGSGVQIYVTDTHHFTTDTILLSNFAAVKNGDRVVELGTGCGTIPLLMIRDSSPKSIIAVELQQDAIELLKSSIDLNLQNGVENSALIHPMHGDIRDIASLLPAGESDLVVCNPPYKQRPERLTDVLSCMRAHDLEPKRLRMVQGRAGKAPKLFLCEAKRGSKPGYMDVLPALIIEDESGFTDEMKQIYASYKEGHDGA